MIGPRRFANNTCGTAAAEFALVLPLLAFIFLNVADLSIYLYSKMQVDLAAQEAVGAARVLCNTSAKLPAMSNCPSLTTTMTAAAQSTTLADSVTLPTASIVEGYYCTDSSGALQLDATYTGTPSTDCSKTLAGSKVAPGDYISAQASLPFTPLFPRVTVASLLTGPITSTAWMRLK